MSVPPAHGDARLFSLDQLAPDASESDEQIEDPPPPLDGAPARPPARVSGSGSGSGIS